MSFVWSPHFDSKDKLRGYVLEDIERRLPLPYRDRMMNGLTTSSSGEILIDIFVDMLWEQKAYYDILIRRNNEKTTTSD